MSNLKKGRIERGRSRKAFYLQGKHRQALPDLLRDFEGRCAYSMQLRETELQVDHFNPTLTGKWRNQYLNLFPATAHCNRFKWDTWPSPADRKLGIRFLNCCEEVDYGEQIFEDPVTHRVFGVTPAGRYHVRHCDLNDDLYVAERRDRAEIRKLVLETNAIVKKQDACLAVVKKLVEIKQRMIPDIAERREGELPLDEISYSVGSP